MREDLQKFSETVTSSGSQVILAIVEKVGFRVDSRFREGIFRDGKYHDRLWMGLLCAEYLANQKGRRK